MGDPEEALAAGLPLMVVAIWIVNQWMEGLSFPLSLTLAFK